jgi:hypothetical protein
MLPMRRETDILIEELPTETLVYDTKRHKVHCLNKTAALLWRHCDGRTSLAKLAKILREEADLPESEELVGLALSDLANRRLLADDRRDRKAEAALWSRRDFARNLGVAAVLVPAIMTVMAPTAAAAGSGANGSRCDLSSNCQSGCCCQDNSGGKQGTCQSSGSACGGNGKCM